VNRMFHMAAAFEETRQILISLGWKIHFMKSGVCLFSDDELLWSDVNKACMQVRDFSDEVLDGNIERNGKSILSSVGCYQLEGEGVQLFDAIAGDYFTILGLPLLPLLAALREHEISHA